MLWFAIFTLGYFMGVFTALAIFPPWTREIEEQEKDARAPLEGVFDAQQIERQQKEPGLTAQPNLT